MQEARGLGASVAPGFVCQVCTLDNLPGSGDVCAACAAPRGSTVPPSVVSRQEAAQDAIIVDKLKLFFASYPSQAPVNLDYLAATHRGAQWKSFCAQLAAEHGTDPDAVWNSKLEQEKRAKRRAEVERMKANSAPQPDPQLDPEWLRSNAERLRSNANHLTGSYSVQH